jgi:hypothetical protein
MQNDLNMKCLNAFYLKHAENHSLYRFSVKFQVKFYIIFFIFLVPQLIYGRFLISVQSLLDLNGVPVSIETSNLK